MYRFLKDMIRPSVLVTLSVVFILLISINLLGQNQTEPDVEVTVEEFNPLGTSSQEANITVKFSNEMVPEDSLDKIVSNPPLRISPSIAGIARWIDTDMLRFYPDSKLLPATAYKVEIDRSQTYINGNRISEERSFEFHTAPLRIEYVNWQKIPDNTKAGSVRLMLYISFNYRVSIAEIDQKLSLKGDNNAIHPELSYEIQNPVPGTNSSNSFDIDSPANNRSYTDNLQLLTEPIHITDEDQKYILRIEEGLHCDDCGDPLKKTYEKAITVEKFRRLYVNSMRAGIENKQPVIYLYLSSPVQTENIKEYLKISPEIEYKTDQQYYQLTLRGDFTYGEKYEVTLGRGVPATDGALLENEFSSIVRIPDIPPTLKFRSKGLFLPSKGAGLLEVESINVDTMSIEIERIFANNIVFALAGQYINYSRYGSPPIRNIGQHFISESMDLDGTLNEPLRTTIDIANFIGDTAQGIYKISARKKDQRWETDARFVIRTDLGIMARMSDEYLMVWVNSLAETTPVKNAVVKLYSRNNQVLLENKTNSKGICVFEDIAGEIKGFDPFLITVEKDDDLSYLRFDECLLATSEFDIKGRPYLTTGYESFLYMDRDIFRPGDTAHIVMVVRDEHVKVPPDFPYFLIILDPTGREYKSFRVKTGENGITEIAVPLPDFTRTGQYSAVARIGEDYEIGRTGFQVEEFMPDKIKTTVTTDNDEYFSNDTVAIDVTGKYLFGPPTAGHKVSGQLTIEPHTFTVSTKPDYTFSDDDRKFSRITKNFSDQKLDSAGTYTYTYVVPDNLTPGSALKGLIAVGVAEQGGRVVSDYKEILIYPYRTYLGIKQEIEGHARPNEPVGFSIIGVDRHGVKKSVKTVQAEFYRVVYQSILKQNQQGYYRYTSEISYELIDTLTIQVSENGTDISFTPPQYGRYKVIVKDTEGGHASSSSFYASGWGYAPWSMEKPDRIEIAFDKKEYKPGDVVLAQVRAPFGGTLLLTIEKDRVHTYETYEMEENSAEIELDVSTEYFPNAYVSATIIKKAVDVDNISPARAYGVAPLRISQENKDLGITVSVPDDVKPQENMRVEVQLAEPAETEITVSAVDAGIIQLTGYQTPDPLDYFYGQRQLKLKPYDIYSFIYPETEQASSHLSPAGGRMSLFEKQRKRHLNPIKSHRVKPVSLWSGLVTTDSSGYAAVDFDLPQFNGQLVISAVAMKEDKFSSASSEVAVKDKIVIQESFPRFLSPNDKVVGLITLFNNTGSTNSIEVNLETEGPVELLSEQSTTVTLEDNTEGAVRFRLISSLEPGVVRFTVTAKTASDSSSLSFELPNRPVQPIQTVYGSGIANSNGAGMIYFQGNWTANTEQYVIKTSGLSAVGFTRNIDYLLHYPYGCLEQTTSQLFPLLYFGGLAEFADSDIINSRGAGYFIQEGLLKLSGLMRDDGFFTYWPNADRVHYWSSIYASHFFLEAQKAGYYINEDIEKKILRNLNRIAEGKIKEAEEAERIYAAYVLAGTGELKSKIVNYLKELPLSSLQPYERYLAAGALAFTGEQELAFTYLPTTIQPYTFEPETGGTFSSGVRTNAILLEVLHAVSPENPSCAVLANELTKTANGGWYTTQETAFGLMALGKYLSGKPNRDFDGTVYIEGDSSYSISAEEFQITRENLGGKSVQITVDGEGDCFYYWQASGIPTDPAPEEFTRGIEITREYLGRDGNPVDVGQIELGDQLVCHITAKAVDHKLRNVVINDLLPAGLEIENPRLKTSPTLSWIPKQGREIEFQDIRDDRLLLFTHLNPNRAVEFYYSLRAISAGEFKIPPVSAECMYSPAVAGASSSGFMVINSGE